MRTHLPNSLERTIVVALTTIVLSFGCGCVETRPSEPSTEVMHSLVDGYAQKSAPDSLDALIAAGSAETPGQAADLALEAAKIAGLQAETLLDEVDRFLNLTQPRPGKTS